MTTQLALFAIISGLYFAQEICLYFIFRKKYGMLPNITGRKSVDELDRFYGFSIQIVSAFYVATFISLIFNTRIQGIASPVEMLDNPLVRYLGFAAGIGFLVLIAVSRMNLGACWRIGIDPCLKTDVVYRGLYRHIRHPYFTALLGFQFAVIFIVPTTLTVFAFILSLVIVNFQARREEAWLEQLHRTAYADYKRRTGRFLPIVGTTCRMARTMEEN